MTTVKIQFDFVSQITHTNTCRKIVSKFKIIKITQIFYVFGVQAGRAKVEIAFHIHASDAVGASQSFLGLRVIKQYCFSAYIKTAVRLCE